MTSIETLKLKISEIEKYYQIVKKYHQYSPKEIEEDETLKGAVERYLYLLCQATIDLGEGLISYFNYRTPSSYGEIFEILAEQKKIPAALAKDLSRMAGFRNILIHSYGKINFTIVYQVLTEDINKILSFITLIKKSHFDK